MISQISMRLQLVAARYIWSIIAIIGLSIGAMPSAAQATPDVRITAFTWVPDPALLGTPSVFTLRASNLGSTSATSGQVSIAIGSNVVVGTTFPSYCNLSGAPGAQTLLCNLPAIAAGSSQDVVFEAAGRTIGAANTIASVTAQGTGGLTISPNVIAAADLSSTLTASATSVAAGDSVTFTHRVSNAGPSSTAAVRTQINIPPGSDFSLTSATGAGWTCTPSGAVVTCDYTGPALTGPFPPVAITGRVVKAIAGTITTNGSVASTDAAIADPNALNNPTPNVVVSVTPGTDLSAGKVMPSVIVEGLGATIQLRINNLGPQSSPAGATITDTIPAGVTIGAMPAGCSLSGRTVACTAGTIAVLGNQSFLIPITGQTPLGASVQNSATVAAPAGFLDPVSPNNTATANYQVVPPSADLSIQKSKSPNPVAANGIVTSVMTVTNNGPSPADYTPTNPIRVTDTLSADETYVGVDTPGWLCATLGVVVTCETTGTGTISAPATSPVVVPGGTTTLQIRTRAGSGSDVVINNTACTGQTGGSGHTPADPTSGNDCTTAGVRATNTNADLQIVKEVSLTGVAGTWTQASLAAPLAVTASDNSYFVRLTVRNNNASGGQVARTVNVQDIIPNYLNTTVTEGALTLVHQTGLALIGSVTDGSCAVPGPGGGGTINCVLNNLAAAEERTITLRVDRALASGPATNTATVFSPDTAESDTSNNTSSAYLDVEPLADITVNGKTVNPNPARVGALITYTLSVKNLGPNEANTVVLTDLVDTSRFEIIPGSVSTTKPGVTTCDFAAGPDRVVCEMGTFQRGQVFQTSFQLRPLFPFAGSPPASFPVSHTNTASVTTTTTEVVGGGANNSFALTHEVVAPAVNLAVTKVEPGPEFDPITFGSQLVYDVRVSNFGLSRATGIVITDTPAPPSGYSMTFDTFAVNPSGVSATSGATLITPPAPTCATVGANIECRLHATNGLLSRLDSNQQVVFRLFFNATGAAPSGVVEFSNAVRVTANEQTQVGTSEFDLDLANNVAVQNTFVLPSVDLEVTAKTRVTASPADIGQPLSYAIQFRNNGPSPITQVKVADQLPAGFVFVSAAVAADGGSAVAGLGSPSCTSGNNPVCTIDGNFPAGAANTATLTIVVRAANPYTGPIGSALTNTASITPGTDGGGNPLGRDPVSGNNSQTATTTLRQSSLAGRVYSDANNDTVIDTGEGIGGVTITLRAAGGIDGNGAPFPDRVMTTNPDGTYSFDRLPPGIFSVIETQPSGVVDSTELAGTSGGTPGPAFTTSQITAINLASATNATGYIFRELPFARIAGYMYRDLDNDGLRETGELGFGPGDFPSAPHVRLTGTDYAGQPVDVTVSVGADGQYSFENVPPSNSAGYSLAQLVAPSNTLDGSDQNGTTIVVANSGGRTQAAEVIALGVVGPAANLTERNFGELPLSTIAGTVWLDANSDATRQAGETGRVPGATIRLRGTNDLGQTIDCLTNTDGVGGYVFGNASDPDPLCKALRPGTYQVEATQIGGLTATGAFIGSAGGAAGGVSGANQAAVGPQLIANIVLGSNQTAANYDFGGAGQGLSGSVFVDSNNNGTRDAGEPGIAGVAITLAGITSGGQNVCSIIGCTATTDASGTWRFPTVPASGVSGYTLTEQSQASAPLNIFADGQDRAGQVNGVPTGAAGNDVITGVVMPANGVGVNYDFGERGSALSGSVYIDANTNNSLTAGEQGLAGVTLTLSGTTSNGQDICAYLGALNPARSCATTTDAAGNYAFTGLPSGTYSLTQTQPALYADGAETAGSSGGTVSSASGNGAAQNVIGGISLGAGQSSLGNNFADRGGLVSGSVYADLNNNGTREGGENGIGGVVMTLSGTTATGLDVCALLASQIPARGCTVTTAADGTYSFAGLPQGTYALVETQPAGYADGIETAGPSGGTPAENTITGIPVGLGTAAPSNLFGETLGTISGVVYVDRDGDGVADSGETPLAGVTITLTGTNAQSQPVTLTVVTGPDGRYNFPNLVGGSYTLTQTQPNAYATATPNVVPVTLAGGGSETVDFGETDGGISGFVYGDLARDGVRNGTDAGIGGVTITLSGTTADGREICALLEALNPAGSCTTTTAPDGSYRFGQVPAGTYQLVETQPAGYANGQENQGSGGGTPSPNRISGIALLPGASAINNNFGEYLGSISGQVFVDANTNLSPDSGERAVSGVTLTLTGTDARGNPVSLTTTTDTTGRYSFPGLVGGDYVITQTQPNSYGNGSANSVPVTLPAGGTQVTNFAEVAGRISGQVYQDVDRNGVPSPGEAPITGATLRLSGNTSEGIDVCTLITCTVVTGSDGTYVFNGLPAGSYTLTQTQPTGFADGPENPGPAGGNPSDNIIAAIPLTGGMTAPANNFGELLGAITGVVYVDSGGDGIADLGETPLAGVTIRLTGTNAQGQAVDITVVTGLDGRYNFPNLIGGDYVVTQTQPSAYGTRTPNVVPVSLGGGATQTVDFGETDGGLSGFVYVDTDSNGTRGPGEVGLSGVNVTLSGTTADGRDICAVLGALSPARSCLATTASDGGYTFPRLPAGTYQLNETQPIGYADGTANPGSNGGAASANRISVITLPAGATGTEYNFGERIGGISGQVFVDANANLTPEGTERTLRGVTITLAGTDAQGRPVNLTTTTDADGRYSFPGLVGGTYTITQTQPGAFGNATPNVVNVTLVPGGAEVVNFAEIASGLSGNVYQDQNRDGVRNGTDPGIAGVTVRLSGTTGDGVDICTLMTCTLQTGSDGSYAFVGLPAGTYTLTETQPSGYGDGAENLGTTGGTASDNVIANIALTGGVASIGNNFGEFLAVITGVTFIDQDGDGIADTGEPGIAGVTIRLMGTDATGRAIDLTTQTDADGRYSFPNLLSGSYTLTQTQPDAFGSSTPNVSPVQLAPGGTPVVNFGELQRALSGTVFIDRDRDGKNDAGEGRLGGITIRLFNASGVLAGTTQTAADGTYLFQGLAPGGYSVEQDQPAGYGSSTPNRVPVTIGTLGDSQIDFGETLVAINGVVYDALARTPVPGASVTLIGPAGFDPAAHLEGGAGAERVLVGADGLYNFRLLPGAPTGQYRLSVVPPATGYDPVWPSRFVTPCTTALIPNTGMNATQVQTNGTAPNLSAAASCTIGGQTTAYFPVMQIIPGASTDVANNHLPVDPMLAGLLRITKTTPQTLVTRGGLVAYAISVTNPGRSPVPNAEVIDRLPAGFVYRAGTAQVDGVNQEPVVRGSVLAWGGLTVQPGQTRTVQMVTIVGANVREGDHVNQARAAITGTDAGISNTSEATVRLQPDVDFDCTDVIGKVFDDRNGNGRQDDGEPGLAGVRVATPTGQLITTDADGRYHIVCIVVPNAERGSNVAIKLDARTLPTGYRVTTENPEVVRATRGRVVRINFGAALMRVVRIDMDQAAFTTESALSEVFDKALTDLVPGLEQAPTVVRLVYTRRQGETEAAAQRRAHAASRRLQDLWNDKPDRCRLIVETQIIAGDAQ
jgi:large repetitive protein